MPPGGLYAPVAIAAATSATSLGVAIYVLVEFRRKTWCYAWVLEASRYNDDDVYGWPNRDYCPEKAWFIVALLCSLLWGVTAWCTFWFIKSGRHAKWEEKHTPAAVVATDVELAVSSPAETEEPVIADAAVVVCEKEDTTD